MITRYDQLDVWQVSMELVVLCYRESSRFPAHELYELTSQLRRAAVSVPANIAEGFGRHHRAEFLHHLSYAFGSLMEVETHLQIALRLDYIDEPREKELHSLTDRIGRMLNRLQNRLREASMVSDSGEPYLNSELLDYEAPGTEHQARHPERSEVNA